MSNAIILTCDLKKTDWKKVRIGFNKYVSIMELVHDLNVQTSGEFQKKFNGFYKIRQRSKDFYYFLYAYLENNKNKKTSFEQTLEFFYKKFDRIEASFSSKIVSTINPDFPVWDSEVITSLGVKKPNNSDKKIRFQETVNTYENMVNWYSEFLKTKEARDMVVAFDENVGTSNITDIKKIDLILWQTREK